MTLRLCLCAVSAFFVASPGLAAAEILSGEHQFLLKSGSLERVIRLDSGNVTTTSFSVGRSPGPRETSV